MPRNANTLPTRLTIAALHARGYSDAQVAKALGLTPAQCRDALTEARAVLEASAVALAADALTASDIAARKGDARPALALLDRLKVTEPTASETSVGIKVEITAGFRLHGLPTSHATPPAIDITPQPVAALPVDDSRTLDVHTTQTLESPESRMNPIAAPPQGPEGCE